MNLLFNLTQNRRPNNMTAKLTTSNLNSQLSWVGSIGLHSTMGGHVSSRLVIKNPIAMIEFMDW